MIPKNRQTLISVFLIWLFHVSGALGILFGNKNLFMAFTPVNLFITFMLLFVNQPQVNKRVLVAAFTAFIVGMIAEILGVNYGLIFGSYEYGDNLGFKILGVPLMIGVNWVMLTFITGAVAARWFGQRPLVAAGLGAVLMVLLDLVIEPVAPRFDYWAFESLEVPIQNYVGWFLVAFPIQWVFQISVKEKDTTFSYHLLLVQFLFFATFALF